MWDNDWELLGLAPTTELAAIKKAYALKLRVTRPDDDAAAYQALRGAYERVQLWVKWQAAAPDEADSPGAEPAAAASTPADTPLPIALVAPVVVDEPPPAAPVEPPAEPEHVVRPRHLIDELELRWRRSGEAALMSGWEEARRELDQQPLSRQAEFSTAFAQWVLGVNLPDAFLKAVNDHFGWLDDFRTERQLGAVLAHALHEALDDRLRPRPLDPAVRALAAPLLGLQALRASGRSAWWLALLGVVLQPLLDRSRGVLGPHWMRQAGLDLEAQRWLGEGTRRGLWARMALVCALVGVAAAAMFGDAVVAGAHVALWFLYAGAAVLAGPIAGALLNHGPVLTTSTHRLALPLDKWRRQPLQPWLGLVWLLFAAWMVYLDANTPAAAAPDRNDPLSFIPPWIYMPAAVGFGIAGVLLAWPLNALHGCVVAGLAVLVAYFSVQLFGAWLTLPACGLLAMAALLWAAAVHEERLPGPAPVRWLLRPLLNSLAVADRWTYSVAVLPLVPCIAWAVLNDGDVSPLRVFVIWVLGILAVNGLQGKADAWGLRQLPGQDTG